MDALLALRCPHTMATTKTMTTWWWPGPFTYEHEHEHSPTTKTERELTADESRAWMAHLSRPETMQALRSAVRDREKLISDLTVFASHAPVTPERTEIHEIRFMVAAALVAELRDAVASSSPRADLVAVLDCITAICNAQLGDLPDMVYFWGGMITWDIGTELMRCLRTRRDVPKKTLDAILAVHSSRMSAESSSDFLRTSFNGCGGDVVACMRRHTNRTALCRVGFQILDDMGNLRGDFDFRGPETVLDIVDLLSLWAHRECYQVVVPGCSALAGWMNHPCGTAIKALEEGGMTPRLVSEKLAPLFRFYSAPELVSFVARERLKRNSRIPLEWVEVFCVVNKLATHVSEEKWWRRATSTKAMLALASVGSSSGGGGEEKRLPPAAAASRFFNADGDNAVKIRVVRFLRWV